VSRPEKPGKPGKTPGPGRGRPLEPRDIDIGEVGFGGGPGPGKEGETPFEIVGLDMVVQSIARALNTARLEASKKASKKIIEVGEEKVEIQSFLDLEEAEVELELGIEKSGEVYTAKMGPTGEGPRARLRMVFRLREEEV